jgi:hypothetical protein
MTSATCRVWLVASAVADRYSAMRTAMGQVHDQLNAAWKPIYEAVVTGQGLRLRPGITMDDFTEIISALSSGMSLHTVTDDGARIIDVSRRRSLLGTAALAVLASCIDPGDGKSLEEAVTEVVGTATR